ncbi:CAP domain-containing protein [Pseudobacillus wudalianchiensis]|uniref:Serine protease n=1 Tax=Pseudobacillus wudalianchiensis TaxID=1743143 RepID=A0A1B9AYX7_9BACI|nr:CAP domain-containing protein [Bacillus wudalianchiensis]OCA89034.1 serine protease [Bacillus wudalianchiensis]
MKSFFYTIIVLFILFVSWPSIEKQIGEPDASPFMEKMLSFTENPYVSEAITSLSATLQQFIHSSDTATEQEAAKVEKPDLIKPEAQAFSIHNIELSDSKEKVENMLGAPKRSSYNEYGVRWHTYHQDYQNFLMVAYDEHNKVAGLYTNQDLIASASGIKLGSPKETVLQKLGEPLSQMRKGLVYMKFQEKEDYDVFMMDNSYVTIFYDKHEQNTVTAIQIISKELEQEKSSFYAQGSAPLKEGFEYQLFDLTNAARVNHHLPVLKWDDQVKGTARKHSADMAKQHYFSHTNLRGQSPFDRMKADHVFFTSAGENLAYGQFSSIFAHEGLMNSLGHRENILRPEYRFLGVGVAFNEEAQPYFTENFFAK